MTHPWRVRLLLAALCSVVSTAHPQTAVPNALRGDLTVWLIGPAQSSAPAPQPYATYREQTAGSFGQNAGSVGRSASDVGQTAGSLGTDASNIGQTAGSYGQTAGSLGTEASNIGQTAGSYGIPAGELGAPPPSANIVAPNLTPLTADSSRFSSTWRGALRDLPRSHLHYAFVRAEDLLPALQQAQAANILPDILIGQPLPWAQIGTLLRQNTMANLGVQPLVPMHDVRALLREAVMLNAAPHPEAARAFMLWLGDRTCPDCTVQPAVPAAVTPARVAVAAADALLQGAPLGALADPSCARLYPDLVSRLALWPPAPASLDGLTLQTTVLRAAANERFAVVSLRTAANAAGGLGVLHPLVVLRRTGEGDWRVLHVSANVPGEEATGAFAQLATYAAPVAPEKLRPVRGVALASPPDGDTRTGATDLWWDDAGDAGLLVVEWQARSGSEWSDTHLQLVADTGARLRTRVLAAFAVPTAQYRWRVWSVGDGGRMAITSWRQLTMLP